MIGLQEVREVESVPESAAPALLPAILPKSDSQAQVTLRKLAF